MKSYRKMNGFNASLLSFKVYFCLKPFAISINEVFKMGMCGSIRIIMQVDLQFTNH